ncbi:MAG: nuclear transport factor 2 family protein [Caldilineaceae bacterium]
MGYEWSTLSCTEGAGHSIFSLPEWSYCSMDISNTKHDRKTVIAAEQALAAAHLTLDVASIDRLLHPDYIIVQPGGTMEDKAQTLASFATGDRHWELAESDEMTVHLHGDTAVVTGRWRGRGRNGDVHFDYQARFLSTWIREAGTWRNLAYMATEIDPPVAPH